MTTKSAAGAAGGSAGACADFDNNALEKPNLATRIVGWVMSYPVHRYWMGFLRFFAPAVWIPFVDAWIVLRYDAVREVLNADASFPVPWGWKMVQVTGGPQGGGRNFVLGKARAKEGYYLSYE